MRLKKRLLMIVLSISLLFGIVPITAFAEENGIETYDVKDNETLIYEFLREELDLNIAAACGILANLYEESKFSPTAYNGNDTGGTVSYGICQWNNGAGAGNRYGSLKIWCESNGYKYNTLEGQLQFMKYELETARYYKYTTLRDDIEESADGAQRASRIWSIYYEGCSSAYYDKRANIARDIYWAKYRAELFQIVKQPTNVTAKVGEKAIVEVEAAGKNIAYYWYFKDANSDQFKYTSTFKGPTYSVKMSDSRDGRQVYCLMTDKYGNTVQSDVVTLSTEKDLLLMGQLESVEVEEGTLAKVDVEAIGNGLTYQWYYKNVNAKKFSYTASFSGPSYFVEMNEARDGRQVYCVVTDERGNRLQTETVTLHMKDVAKIVTQPENVVIEKGNIAYVEVEAKGKDLTYAWYYKNAGATKFSYTKSFKTGTYFVEMNKTRDGRQVYCVITDAYGNSVQTETVSLHMGNPLEIVSQPKNVKVKSGGKAKVEVIATGDDLTYTWFFKNAGSKKFSYTAAFMGPTYSVVMSKARAGRQVYCVITDAYGNSVQTETATLNMK